MLWTTFIINSLYQSIFHHFNCRKTMYLPDLFLLKHSVYIRQLFCMPPSSIPFFHQSICRKKRFIYIFYSLHFVNSSTFLHIPPYPSPHTPKKWRPYLSSGCCLLARPTSSLASWQRSSSDLTNERKVFHQLLLNRKT